MKDKKKPIAFLNYVFENHYYLYDVTKGKYTYKDSEGNLIKDKELYKRFKNE